MSNAWANVTFGWNYSAGSITFASNPSPATAATGSVAFTVNPTSGNTLTLNGTVVHFGTDVTLGVGGSALATTLTNLLAFLQASSDPQISKCTYAIVASTLDITYAIKVAAGDNFTLATNVTGTTVTGMAGGIDPQTITLGGTPLTFVASGASGAQCDIGAALVDTLANLKTVLNASNDSAIKLCTYDVNATQLLVSYKTPGPAGDAFTLATNIVDATPTATLSGATAIGPCDPGTAWNLVNVTLSENYFQTEPDGPLPGHFPTRPIPNGGGGVVWYPQTISSGNRRQYWQCEAAAIVAAGIGAYS